MVATNKLVNAASIIEPHSLGGLIQQNIIAVFFSQNVSMLLFLLPSFLGLLCFRLVNGSWCNKGNLLLVFLWHVHLESVRNSNPGLGLVHLQENADDPGDGTEGGVEHVAVLRRRVHLLRLAVSHSQPPGLVVKAVAAADKFPESSPTREPGFKVKFL